MTERAKVKAPLPWVIHFSTAHQSTSTNLTLRYTRTPIVLVGIKEYRIILVRCSIAESSLPSRLPRESRLYVCLHQAKYLLQSAQHGSIRVINAMRETKTVMSVFHGSHSILFTPMLTP